MKLMQNGSRGGTFGLVADVNLKGFEDAAKALYAFPKIMDQVQYRALREAIDAMKAEAVRRITARYYISSTLARASIRVDRTDHYRAMMRVWGRRLTADAFRITPKQRPFRAGKFRRGNGISFAIKREGGMHNMRRGFWLEGWKTRGHGTPFYRYASARDGSDYDSDFMAGIRPIVSLAIPQMMKTSQVLEPTLEAGQNRLTQQLKYWIPRAVKGGSIL